MNKSFWQPAGRLLIWAAVACALLVSGIPVAQAQSIVLSVTTTEDVLDDNDGVLSLREAIITANGDPSNSYRINLQNKTYRLEIEGRGEDGCLTGDLDISGNVLIDGWGPYSTAISGDDVDRVFDVSTGAQVEIRQLEVTGGRTACRAGGGGIYVSNADLTLNEALVRDNKTGDCSSNGSTAGNGGGIRVTHSRLVIRNQSEVAINSTGRGADTNVPGDDGGHAGDGGGIWINESEVTITDSEIYGNSTGHGGDGDDGVNQGDGGNGGDGGDGGGLFVGQGSTVTITDSHLWDNSCGRGGDGGDGADGSDPTLITRGGDGGDGGRAGYGGGIYTVNDPVVELVRSQVSRNTLGGGGDGGCAGDSGGGARGRYGGDGRAAGLGGGIYSSWDSTFTLSESSIWNNHAEGTRGAAGRCKSYGTVIRCDDGSQGRSASGGGMLVSGTLTLSDSAVHSNWSAGLGGGIVSYSQNLTLISSTISNNESTGSWAGAMYLAPYIPSVIATHIDHCTITNNQANNYGGIYSENEMFEVNNSIVAGNIPNTSSPLPGAFNLVSGDPGVEPLADNGGPTLTRALQPSSPALDAGDPAIPAHDPDPATDQRGFSRVEGGRIDIGAYELDQPSQFVNPGASPNTIEGDNANVRGDIAVSGSLQSLTLRVEWPDGQISTYDYGPGTTFFVEGGPQLIDDDPTGTPQDEVPINLNLWEDDDPADQPSDTATVMMTVHNRAPEMTSLDIQAITEGETAVLEGSFLDQGQADTFNLDVDWGDGQNQIFTYAAGTRSFAEEHRYVEGDASGSYTVQITLADDDTGQYSSSVAAPVANAPPEMLNLRLVNSTIDEGQTTTLKATIDEPGVEDPLTLEVDWDGDGSSDESFNIAAGTSSFSVSHAYPDDEPSGTPSDTITIGAVLSDDDGGTDSETVALGVNNSAPTLGGLIGTACDEGGTCTVSGSITDAGSLDSFTLDVEWGDGDDESFSYAAGTASFSESHLYLDDAPSGSAVDAMVVTLTITDDDTGSTTSTTTVTVSNLAPTLAGVELNGVAPSLVNEGEPATLSGSITDAGVQDTFTLEVDWGDGTTETFSYPAGTSSFAESHFWADDDPTGTPEDPYTVNLTLRDDDEASDVASLAITVRNRGPVARIDTEDPEGNPLETDEDTVLTVVTPGVLANDTDSGDDELQVTTLSVISNLGAQVTLTADGAFAFDPTPPGSSLQGLDPGEEITDWFEYSIIDDDGATSSSYAEVRVTGADESGAIYVDDTASGAGDGSSWSDAFTELQAALAVAWGGNEVHVAAGTYLPDYDPATATHTQDPEATFALKRNVALYGGFPDGGGDWAQRNPTVHQSVLSGATGGIPSEHVVSATDDRIEPQTRIDGFVITGGVAGLIDPGGGMLIRWASPTVARCTFLSNTAGKGGGLAAIWGASPWVVNSSFISNQAIFTNGGGAYTEATEARFVNCVFRGNSAADAGGGLAVGSGETLVAGCSFASNNAATLGGGAAAAVDEGVLSVANSILWDNTAGAGDPELHNGSTQAPEVAHSDIEGSGGSGSGWWAAQSITDLGGNLDADPQWVAPPADLHLGPLSGAADVGNNSLVPVDGGDIDLDGDVDETTDVDYDMLPRFSGIVDMGAFEYQTDPVATVLPIGTGHGRVTSVPTGIDCGSTCTAAFTAFTPVAFTATADPGSTFQAWLPPCLPTANPCTLVMSASVTLIPILTQDPTVDLAITKTDHQAAAAPGSPVTYTISVRNLGPEDAIGATVTDLVPDELTAATWTCDASPGSSCTGSGAGSIDDTVDILAGGVLTYTLTGIAEDVHGSGALVNIATVTAPVLMPDSDPSNNSSTDVDSLGAVADLVVTKDDGLTAAAPGQQLVYTITLTNDGPSDAMAATVDDILPPHLEAASWTCTASAGSTCTPSGFDDIVDTVDVAAGGQIVYELTATVAQGAVGVISNTAVVVPGAGVFDPDPGSNSSTDTDVLGPAADLVITVDDGVAEAVPATTVVYTVTASNPAGPSAVTGARVTDDFPSTLDCSWSCAGSGGGVCTAGPVAGDVHDDVDLPVGGAVTYTATCGVSGAAVGTLANTATVEVPPGGVELASGDNSSTDTDTLLEIDLGDAPEPFATLLVDTGASHGIVPGSYLGSTVDADADGQPDAAAAGDDDDGNDDEDGVVFTSALVTCETAQLTVTASANGLLDAWLDLDGDGSWDDTGEQVFASRVLTTGDNDLEFNVPCAATAADATFARFRFSSEGGLAPTGGAYDGEVEDYQVALRGLDFGDAPDPTYPTLLASDGGRHVVVPGGPTLGAMVDAEPEGRQSATGTGDDNHGADDEDGVVFDAPIAAGGSASITVTASAPALLSAWVDWNGNGSWADAEDQVLTDQTVTAGANSLGFMAPTWVTPGSTTMARFRLDSGGGLRSAGIAADGEVEDYRLTVGGAADLAVTIDDGVDDAVPGESITYEVAATNAGPTPSSDVQVASAFAAALACSWTCSPSAGATCAASGSGDIADSISLEAGATATYSALCDIDPAAAGTLASSAAVQGSLDDPEPANNSSSDSDALTPRGDLMITVDDGQTESIPGRLVSYTLTVSNAGPSTATAATVTVVPPAELENVAWICTADAASSFRSAGSGAIDEMVTVAAGGSVIFVLDGQISAAATGSLATTASVTAPVGFEDVAAGNNSSTDVNALMPTADLEVDKSSFKLEFVDPGANPRYQIEVANRGPSDAGGVTVSDVFPAECEGATWSCTAEGGAGCTAGPVAGDILDVIDLPAGERVLYEADCTVASDASGALVNTATATVAAGATDPDPSDNSSTKTLTIAQAADLGVVIDNDQDWVVPTQEVTYSITVSNEGPADAGAAIVAAVMPTCFEGGSWTCSASGAGSCTPGPVSGALSDLGSLPAGETLSYELTARVLDCDEVKASADVRRGDQSVYDPDLADNQAVDIDPVVEVDWGDAPDASIGSFLYPTVLVDDGARHGILPGLFVGELVDGEVDGQPSADADGDDMDGLPTTPSDEDGVLFTSGLLPGGQATVQVTAASAGLLLDAWVDFGADGGWGETEDRIFEAEPLVEGPNALTFTVPASAVTGVDTFARFRVSSTGVAAPNGAAIDGEVEDHLIGIGQEADLALGTSAASSHLQPGATTLFTFEVSNLGPSRSSGGMVTDVLPMNLSFVGSADGCVDNVGTVSCLFGPLLPAGSLLLTFDAVVDPAAGDGLITNGAMVAGNETDPVPANDVSSAGIVVDGSPPTVLAVSAGSEAVADCDTLATPPREFLVDFSEDLFNPPGDDDADDVTNPDNYLLVGAGADQQFDTVACGEVLGDDVAVDVGAVTIADPSPPPTVPVTLSLAARPPEGLLRLYVCGTTSIYDLAGNALDGDGDGDGGDDFVRYFRLDSDNRLLNPHLDCDMTGWTASSGTPGEIDYSTEDADGSPHSGSLLMRQLAADTDFFVSQCVETPAQRPVTAVVGRARIEAEPGITLTLASTCEVFALEGCTGASLGTHHEPLLTGDSGGAWILFGGPVTPVWGGSSAHCEFGLTADGGEDFTAWVDQLRVTAPLFADGFKSGDTSAWSVAIP